MDKKIFGIKIGTYLSVLLSLVCAVVFWLYVNIVDLNAEDLMSSALAVISNFIG